jgi:pyridoxine 4-dehydrogenase
LKSHNEIPQGDLRRILPRYQPNTFDHNLILVKEIEKFAARKGCTAAQVALGWILGLSARENMPIIVPIPGSSKYTFRSLRSSL